MKRIIFLLLGACLCACGRYGCGVPAGYEPLLDAALAGCPRADSLRQLLRQTPREQREGMAFLIAHMPRVDRDTMRLDLLRENVDFAYRARREYPWTRALPDSVFLNEVLPYAAVDEVRDSWTQSALVYSLVGVPNGVVAMSFAVPGLVETSTNLASVKFAEGTRIVVTSSQRSSVESAKTYVMQMVESVFALAGADVAHSDGYPGWAPNPQSVLREKTGGAYERLFGAEPKVRAIHAGLECGIIGEKYPEMEMISFGPTLRHPHSPDEKVEIASVGRYWKFHTALLEYIPEK